MCEIKNVCKTNYISISHCSADIPGMYQLDFLKCDETPNETEIAEMAKWLWHIRKKLERYFQCIVGIYSETDEKNQLHTIVLPFHIHALLKLDIPFEPYQPHIERYIKEYHSTMEERKIIAVMDDELRRIANSNDFFYPFPCSFKIVPKKLCEENDRIIIPEAEVNTIDEAPEAPDDLKCFVCIGGEKNYQCFFAENNLSRAGFMQKYQKSIPWFLRSIYYDDGIEIHQDAKYAVPGFLIISPVNEYRDIAAMPMDLYQRSFVKAFKLREMLLKQSDVKNVFVYYDEHYQKAASVHIWVLPIYKINLSLEVMPSMFNHSIWDYMGEFEYQKEKDRIVEILNDVTRYNI